MEADTSAIGTFRVTLRGPMLRRGLWLYVWRVVRRGQQELLYVGRTGDNSSPNASSPYNRMGQHLGLLENQNALRRHLSDKKIEPEDCERFEFVAHGPIYPEIAKPENFKHSDKAAVRGLMELHTPYRNIVGSMERRLADELSKAGYTVLNTVNWSHDLSDEDWLPVRRAFEADFPKLKKIG